MLELLDSHDSDAEFHCIAAWFVSEEDPGRAERLIDRALLLDPGYADAWQALAIVRRMRGNMKGARQALDRCVEESASTTDCVYERIRLGRASGAPCAELEANAKILLARESPSPNGHYYLALALAGQGERDAASKALVPRWKSLPKDRRGAIEAREAAQLALHFGDFEQARRLVNELEGHVKDVAELALRAHHAILTIDMALEMGHEATARAAVESAARELPAWSRPIEEHVPKVGFWFEPWLLGKRIELGTLARPTGRELDRWRALDDIQRRSGLAGWALSHGLTAVTSERARAAVSAMPAGAQPLVSDQSFIVNHAAGKTLLLADRAREAEPYLRAAASCCDGFELPLLHARNQLLLGRSREAIDDRPGACAAYQALLDRWGKTKPLPATASAARTRSRALRCEP
jgi:serine/threonine-protein kinase